MIGIHSLPFQSNFTTKDVKALSVNLTILVSEHLLLQAAAVRSNGLLKPQPITPSPPPSPHPVSSYRPSAGAPIIQLKTISPKSSSNSKRKNNNNNNNYDEEAAERDFVEGSESSDLAPENGDNNGLPIKSGSNMSKDPQQHQRRGVGAAGRPRQECQELSPVECHLETRELWEKFHDLGTEMIITKTGR